MPQYRKKPVVIVADLWMKNGDHPEDHSEPIIGEDGPFLSEGKVVRRYRRPDDFDERECDHCHGIMRVHGWIDTLEGGHIVCPGDYVITGIKREMYPCKPDVFVATYDLVA